MKGRKIELNSESVPVVLEPMRMNDVSGRCIDLAPNSVSVSGYYGYQPLNQLKNDPRVVQHDFNQHQMQVDNSCDMDIPDIQFNNWIEPETEMSETFAPAHRQVLPAHRKRSWEVEEEEKHAGFYNCKKRRENDPLMPLTVAQQQPTPMVGIQKEEHPFHMRQPTHNVPDVPRCLMGHYV